MIKLTRTRKPKQLTKAVEKVLTDEFIKTGNSVWNKPYIKKNLLLFSYNKCCFCETNIVEVSKYLEVEHFRYKKLYPKDVVKWDNLLPVCRRCNGKKGTHDVVKEPIIEPTIINPKSHLYRDVFRIKGKDDLGKMTISVLNLNETELCKARFQIGNSLTEEFEKLNEKADKYISGVSTDTRTKNRIINGMKGLIKQGLPQAHYSAVTASCILNDKEYLELKLKINMLGLWDKELIDLETEISKIAL